jgi:hypothetical protein
MGPHLSRHNPRLHGPLTWIRCPGPGANRGAGAFHYFLSASARNRGRHLRQIRKLQRGVDRLPTPHPPPRARDRTGHRRETVCGRPGSNLAELSAARRRSHRRGADPTAASGQGRLAQPAGLGAGGGATAGPVLIRRAPHVATLGPPVIAAILMLGGLVFQIYAKLTLRRSFGVAPANRGLTVSGALTLRAQSDLRGLADGTDRIPADQSDPVEPDAVFDQPGPAGAAHPVRSAQPRPRPGVRRLPRVGPVPPGSEYLVAV